MTSLVAAQDAPALRNAPAEVPLATLDDSILLQRLGSPEIRGGALDALLDELLRRDPSRYPLEIKSAMQRRLIHRGITEVARIASYRGFCQATFPGETKIDFSGEFQVQLENEETIRAWQEICDACPGRGLNFQRLCTRVEALTRGKH